MEAIGWQSAEYVSRLRCWGFGGFVFPGFTPWAKFCRAAALGNWLSADLELPQERAELARPLHRGEKRAGLKDQRYI
jgi:hypothetical protein